MRQALATLLAIVAGFCAVGGAAAWYVRGEVVDRRAFADRAVAALDDPAARAAVRRELTAQVMARVPASIVPQARVEQAVDELIGTRAFRRAVRRGAADVNRLLFDDGAGEEAALRVGALADALGRVDPRLAGALPPGATAELLTLRAESLGVGTPALADAAETLATVLPAAAAVALALALLAAADRRRALRSAGVATAIAAGLALLALVGGRSVAVDGAAASEGVTGAQARDAVAAIWDVYADGLRTWMLVALGAGVALAALTLVPLGRRRTASRF